MTKLTSQITALLLLFTLTYVTLADDSRFLATTSTSDLLCKKFSSRNEIINAKAKADAEEANKFMAGIFKNSGYIKF